MRGMRLESISKQIDISSNQMEHVCLCNVWKLVSTPLTIRLQNRVGARAIVEFRSFFSFPIHISDYTIIPKRYQHFSTDYKNIVFVLIINLAYITRLSCHTQTTRLYGSIGVCENTSSARVHANALMRRQRCAAPLRFTKHDFYQK